jgi:hypothetical protein
MDISNNINNINNINNDTNSNYREIEEYIYGINDEIFLDDYREIIYNINETTNETSNETTNETSNETTNETSNETINDTTEDTTNNTTNYTDNNLIDLSNNIQQLITEVERENNGTYREALIGNFLNEGLRNGLLESLLLVGTNIIINDFSGNRIGQNESTNIYDNIILNNVIKRSFRDKSSYKNVLSETGEQSLKKVKFNPEKVINHSCPIYHVDFTEDMEVTQLPSKHVFTTDGIEKWLKSENAICPVCRYKLDSKEVKREIEEDTNTNTNYSYNQLSQEYNLNFPILNYQPTTTTTTNPDTHTDNNTDSENINMENRVRYVLLQEIIRQEEALLEENIINNILGNRQ